jgi:hypothetical protein
MRTTLVTRSALFAGAIAMLSRGPAPAQEPARVAQAGPVASHEALVAELCNGDVDVAIGPRPMTHEERAACARAGRRAFEVPVGYDAIVVARPAGDAWIDALSPAEIARAFGRAGEGERTLASTLRAGLPDAPLRLVVPARGTPARALLDELLLPAGGLRGDVEAARDGAALAHLTAPGLIASAPLGALPAGLVPVAIDEGRGAPVAPTIEAVQRHAYASLARLVYAHAAASGASRPDVASALATLVDAPAPRLVPLSDEARAFAHAGLAARARPR